MEKANLVSSLEFVQKNSTKRNFKQSFDLIINLTGLNLKKPEEQLDTVVNLHFSRGKAAKICALVGAELHAQAKEVFSSAIVSDDFSKYDKKTAKKLAEDHDFFVAQGNIMAQVASSFGKVFGPRGKMPNPKIGCVVPPNANLKQVNDRLQKLVRLSAKTTPVLQTHVGTEEMKVSEVADNIVTIYKAVVHALPQEKNNIKNIILKLTMGTPHEISDKGDLMSSAENKPIQTKESKENTPAKEETKKKPLVTEKNDDE